MQLQEGHSYGVRFLQLESVSCAYRESIEVKSLLFRENVVGSGNSYPLGNDQSGLDPVRVSDPFQGLASGPLGDSVVKVRPANKRPDVRQRDALIIRKVILIAKRKASQEEFVSVLIGTQNIDVRRNGATRWALGLNWAKSDVHNFATESVPDHPIAWKVVSNGRTKIKLLRVRVLDLALSGSGNRKNTDDGESLTR